MKEEEEEEEEEESQRKSESKQTYVLGHIQAGALRVGTEAYLYLPALLPLLWPLTACWLDRLEPAAGASLPPMEPALPAAPALRGLAPDPLGRDDARG